MATHDVNMKGRAKAMKDRAAQLRPVPVGGLTEGIVMVTPKGVQRLKHCTRSGFGRVSLSGPRLLEPRAVITFSIFPEKEGVKALKPGVRLYDAGIIFPDSGTPSDHFEIVEIDIGPSLHKTYLKGKSGKSYEEDLEWQDLILTALGRDRYWFAIPSNAYPDVSVYTWVQGNQSKSGTLKVTLTNRDYARRFAEINDPDTTRWVGTNQRKMSVTGFAMLGLAVVFLFTVVGIAACLEGSADADISEESAIIACTGAFILIGIGAYFHIRSSGEPI